MTIENLLLFGTVQEIQIDKEGNFSLSGKLKYRHGENIDLGDIITGIVFNIEQLAAEYGRYMRDGKLVGQEKANLKKMIREALKSILVLRLYLSKRFLNDDYPESNNPERGYRFSIVLDESDFTITGKLSTAEFNRYNDFHDWYVNSILPLFHEFSNEIRASLKDGALHKDEVTWINKTLDNMIDSLLVMDFKITHYSIKS